ncbi:oxidoreductase [Maledivibacter halophilus]|uniref:2,4-dienoyl-CoA reductase n=1 Tax=Maledivibacter halophilus TaxID=36842 RepID=A0A1T5M845_9FIRM|nr:FAD-dependent oxidoreductase [Maledivibacter halophilus]SKC84422.1 2,4-dienoyl-CoA reductase [Maledivibacter halophilus]
MTKEYSKILEPITIGKVKVRNRINMAPMTTLYAGHNGEITEQCVQYYGARARGGTGMVTIEGAYVNETALQIPCSINVSDDKFIPGLSRIADAIKDNGSVAVLQLIHSGIQAWVEQSVGPSEIGRIDGKPISTELTPRALTTKEVHQYVQDFANAAYRAKMAGFDMVQVHGTHGYLIMQFLSPITNKRIDNYGADRDLFPVEIVKAIKEKCGKDFPVIFRLCADESLGDDLVVGGITLEDAKKTALKLEKAGVDAFDVTGGSDDVIHLYVPSSYVLDGKEGCFLDLAAEIKKVVNVPVISGGGIDTPKAAQEALESGKVDMLFVGRQLIAEPEWIRKIEEGRVEDIRPCVKCVECGKRIVYLRDMRCSVNPLGGNEWKYLNEREIPRALDKKKVLVIGGGPAGLEAAKTSAVRGHDVTLVEKEASLGGTLKVAAVPSFKSRYGKLIKWYENQIKDLNINILLNKKADLDFINNENPDVVILATGSEEVVPPISGIENAIMSDDVLLGNKEVGDNVIVIGCGLVGAEVAYYIAKNNKNVNVFEALPATDLGMGGLALLRPHGLFDKYGVKVHFKTPIIDIYKDGVLTVDEYGKKIITKADTIVCAVGRKPAHNHDFVKAIQESGKVVKPVGDVKSARKVSEALYEAFNAAMSI